MALANNGVCIVVRGSTCEILHAGSLTRAQQAIGRLTVQHLAQLWWNILWFIFHSAVDDRVFRELQHDVVFGVEIPFSSELACPADP